MDHTYKNTLMKFKFISLVCLYVCTYVFIYAKQMLWTKMHSLTSLTVIISLCICRVNHCIAHKMYILILNNMGPGGFTAAQLELHG